MLAAELVSKLLNLNSELYNLMNSKQYYNILEIVYQKGIITLAVKNLTYYSFWFF